MAADVRTRCQSKMSEKVWNHLLMRKLKGVVNLLIVLLFYDNMDLQFTSGANNALGPIVNGEALCNLSGV